MRIVHLSDMHIDKDTLIDSKVIFNELFNTIEKLNVERKIDLIICSGDLINKGANSFDNKLSNGFLAFKMHFIDVLVNKTGIDVNNIVLGIGNHDICRSADSEFVEAGLKQVMINTAEVNKYYDSNPTEGIKRVTEFKSFEQKYYSGFDKKSIKMTSFETSFKFEFDGLKIGVSSFNTAWRCYNDNEQIILGERQILNSYDFIKDCDVKIAVAHHHFSQLASFERILVEKHLNLKYDLYFTGHIHTLNAQYCETPNGKMFTFVAPGILSKNKYTNDTKYQNGFSVVDYDLTTGEIISSFFKQNYPNSFCLNSDIIDGGIWKAKIPLGVDAIQKIEIQKLLISIKEEYIPKTDEHLLSYNSETTAPKSINEIFVKPTLVSKKNNSDSDKITEKDEFEIPQNLELTDLINSENNFILFGIKEVGKTVTLDKILIDILQQKYNKPYIPVFFEFKQINKDFSSLIRTFWKVKRSEYEGFISTSNILLLVDNISFEEENQEKILLLKTFLENHSNVRFIGTSLLMFEDEVSINAKMNPYNLPFETVYIRQFKSKQINQLISKWFPSNVRHENPKKFDTLINAFLNLNLPRTPFAVSLFLYIIERQQNYRPQNNATLIERYIKDLLQNKEDKEYLRETFDYDNKIWLLSNIAYEMLTKDRDNYYLSYSEVLEIAENHLRVRKFPSTYGSKKIIDEILRLGMFIEDGSTLRFRFNCFFEYFLVKKMQNDPCFLAHVLSEENYLKYSNEIDYYTGLRRGEDSILSSIVDRLEYNYIDINDFIFSKITSVDEFYNINNSIVKKMTVNDLLNLLPEKKNDEKEEKISDNKLENCKKNDEIIKKKDSNKFNDFGKLLILSMRVLKNSEEISIENLKYTSYKKILTNSISYCILFKMICQEMVKHDDKFGKSRIDELKTMLAYLPYLHQILVSDNMGTFKLAEIVTDKITEDTNSNDVSEFEKFLSIFLYYDIKGPDYIKKATDFIKTINRSYVADASLLKLYEYYYASTHEKEDKKILNLIADLYIKVNSTEHKRLDKGAIIVDLEKRKKKNEIDLLRVDN